MASDEETGAVGALSVSRAALDRRRVSLDILRCARSALYSPSDLPLSGSVVSNMGAIDRVYVKPTPEELEIRFLEVLGDGRFQGIGHWELSDSGDVVVSPVTGEHAGAQYGLASELERQLGGRAWGEQGIRRADGAPIVPDVLWADAAFFRDHKKLGILPVPPRLCIEIPSPSNDPEALRAKCRTYVALGAEEAWIVDPVSETVEIYATDGRRTSSSLAFDFVPLWERLR